VNPTVCFVMGHLNSASLVLLSIISEECSFSNCSCPKRMVVFMYAFGDVTEIAEL
jgi:hypothetical protein